MPLRCTPLIRSRPSSASAYRFVVNGRVKIRTVAMPSMRFDISYTHVLDIEAVSMATRYAALYT